MSEHSPLRAATRPDYGELQLAPSVSTAAMKPVELEPAAPSVPLTHYIWVLRRHLWKLIAFVAAVVLATAIFSARIQPIFESTATIVIDPQAPTEVVGQESNRPAGGDSDQFLSTQVRLVQSDAVLRPVAEEFHLVNAAGDAQTKGAGKSSEIAAAPVSLGGLKVNRSGGTYLILISFRSTNPVRAADIANAVANSYLAHTYNIRIRSSASISSFMDKQLDELKAKMEESSLALAQFEKDLDVINPEEKTNIISARLLQLNQEYTTAEAERVRKEAALNAIKSGSLEAAEVSSQAGTISRLDDALNLAQAHFSLVKTTYGPSHPEYRKAETQLAEVKKQMEDTRKSITERVQVEYGEALNREQMLQKAVADTKAEWDHLNYRWFEYQQLKREAETDKALYDELIRKIREADINAGFRDNNIRIADMARPAQSPVYPNVQRNISFAFFLSILLAIAAALLLDTLDTTLRDPKEAGRFLGVDVIGTMPLDRVAAQLTSGKTAVPPLTPRPEHQPLSSGRNGYYHSASNFEEAVRTIRNTILLSDFEGRLRSIVLTSASPSEGKSTVVAHLAIANADRGKKTLLVDGDLRRPSLHAKFNISPHEGLSNVLNGDMAWQDVVLPVAGRPNLSILPAGPGSHRAADLIGPRLATLLDEFAKVYDLVLLDSPPLLGFAECLQIASAADGVLIISLAGETKRRAVAEVISVLRRLHANILGVVLNQVSQNTSSDGYSYYGYYQDRYHKQNKNASGHGEDNRPAV